MSTADRREFFKQAGQGAAAAATALAISGAAHARGANEQLVVGVIGPGGMGSHHVDLLAKNKQVRLAYVCDVDETRLAAAAATTEKLSGSKPQAVKDLRRVLDDKSVDAVWIATPDHWHGPATILACDAGKHVYVEKPCAHNIREGRLMIEAAERNKKVVQVGTQSRSTAHVRQAIERLRAGRDRPGAGLQGLEQPAAQARSAMPSRATRRPRSTTTCGSAPRRWCRIRATCCRAFGDGGTISAPATWATTACTTSTWPAGGWASIRIPTRSRPWAASIFSTTTSSFPTRNTWCSSMPATEAWARSGS